MENKIQKEKMLKKKYKYLIFYIINGFFNRKIMIFNKLVYKIKTEKIKFYILQNLKINLFQMKKKEKIGELEVIEFQRRLMLSKIYFRTINNRNYKKIFQKIV